MPRITRAKQHPLSPAETELLIRGFNRRHPRMGPAMELMARLGLRINEALEARRSWLHDLHSANPTIHIPGEATKTKIGRTLPISPTLRHYFLTAPARVQMSVDPDEKYDPYLTWSRWETRPSATYFARILNHVSHLLLHRSVRSHTLRHTFATELLRHTNLRVVQLALGHRSITSTELYTHPTLQDLAKALDQLDLTHLQQAIDERP